MNMPNEPAPVVMSEADLQRLVEVAHLVTSAQDAMSDEIVHRLASALSEGITLLDRLTRNEGMIHMLREMDRLENQRFLICLSNAFTAASRDLATLPPARGGLMELLKLVSDPGVQEGLRLLAIVASKMSQGLRDIHRRGG
jgi:uncharacterized protein YjgD (DUF1641 family)